MWKKIGDLSRYILYIFVLTLPIRSYTIEVTIKQGKLIGATEATIFDRRIFYAFYGVPYAQPPVGKLRFLDPKPAKKWIQPLDASTEYHGACAQAHVVHKHALYGIEDCLHLNIYTPHLPKNEKSGLKPVVVWIHGYAFTSSFSHIYGADFLIDNDVLFVSVTHRLGVFGFAKINGTDSHANMGLKDIVMALKWIRKNVKKFGGDKHKITVMGSSSGATFLSLLLTTKHRNLFSKAILQSGSLFSSSIFQGDHNLEYRRLVEQLKNNVNKDIKKASAKDIIAASQKIYSNKEIMNFQRPVVPFSPVIEKESDSLINKRPEEVFLNMVAINMPILIGFNSQESIPEAIPFLHNSQLLKSLSTFLKFMVPFSKGCKYDHTSETYRKISKIIKNKYFKNGISENTIEDFLKYVSDLQKYPVYKFIQSYLKKNKKMYVYKFNYVGTFNAVKATSTAGVNLRVKGAANGDEICYLLKCEPLWQNYVKVSHDTTHRDRIFIKQLAELWANFAKTGEPTPDTKSGEPTPATKSGEPTPATHSSNNTWLPMTREDDNVFLISNVNKLTNSKLEKNMFSFWNDLYDAYYSNDKCNKKYHDEF